VKLILAASACRCHQKTSVRKVVQFTSVTSRRIDSEATR